MGGLASLYSLRSDSGGKPVARHPGRSVCEERRPRPRSEVMTKGDRFTLCVFAKPPRPGQVKTRLAGAIGDEAAVALAEAFLRDTWDCARALPGAVPVLATTAARGALPALAPGATWLQGPGDLGARLGRVMRRALRGKRPVIVIGADSPGLPPSLITGAAKALSRSDAVLGPADDGGFYLIGLRRCPAGLLTGLPWSTRDTSRQTLARLRSRRLSVTVLAPWFDVDRADDLRRLSAMITAGEVNAPHTARALAARGWLTQSVEGSLAVSR